MIIEYYINEYNDLAKKHIKDNSVEKNFPILNKDHFGFPTNRISNIDFLNHPKFGAFNFYEIEIYKELEISIILKKILLDFQDKGLCCLYVYRVSYYDKEYLVDYIENEKFQLVICANERNFSDNDPKDHYNVGLNVNVVRLDREESNHKHEKFFLKNFNISVLNKRKVVSYNRKDLCGGISKNEELITTYAVFKNDHKILYK